MSAKDKSPSLVDLVAKATEADLASIDEQIKAKESELDEATKRIGGELDALKSLRKVIDLKLHGKPERKKRQPAVKLTQNGNGHEPDGFRLPPPAKSRIVTAHEGALASEIIGHVTLHGPGFPAAIARKLDRTETGVKMAVSKSDGLKTLADGRVALSTHDESE